MFENLVRLTQSRKEDIYFERIWKAVLRRIKLIPHIFCFYLPFGFYACNRKKLALYRDKYKGKRCFIIANGPSLKKIDFNLLKDEFTLGMNRIYLMKEENGFLPNFVACTDVEEQLIPFHKDLDKLDIPCFFNFVARKYYSHKDNQLFYLERYNPAFRTDFTKRVGSGKSVTYEAMELAYYLGFSEVYLIGKDHSFNINKAVGKGNVSDGNDENHFTKNYFRPGDKWSAPDFKGEEYAYSLARKAFEKDGRIIKDATIGGKLQVFEKVDFFSLFK